MKYSWVFTLAVAGASLKTSDGVQSGLRTWICLLCGGFMSQCSPQDVSEALFVMSVVFGGRRSSDLLIVVGCRWFPGMELPCV
eukprot:g45034.t1